MNRKAFERLLDKGISLTRISIWPDRMEAADFSFYANARKLSDPRPKSTFFASCWTLESGNRAHFDNDRSFERAQCELLRDGSASMWEAYCSRGGVRISTTVEKLDRLLEESPLKACTISRSPVRYLAKDDPLGVLGKTCWEETLFHKRIGYRHEAEYRYVTHTADESSDYINLPISNAYDFLDEVLVFPLKNSRIECIANYLHQKGSGIATHPSRGINTKNGCTFCRVSQLYGAVSQEIGGVRFSENG
jgi:hypothetical protein